MKVAIIGAGRNRNGIGEYIAKYFHKNGAKVVSVFGSTEKTAKNASVALRKYGIKSNSYTDFYKMVGNEKPDAAVIASPSLTHYEYLMKCIDSGLSIFCEKPFIRNKTGDLTETTKNILEKVEEKKLTLAMNSQLPFSMPYYEKLCGKISVKESNSFRINMSPSISGKEMIPESLPHPLSILYFVFGEGEISNLVFESLDEKKIILRFKYVSKTNECAVLIKLMAQKKQPRDFSFGFNDKIVTRTVDIPYGIPLGTGYNIYFNYKGKRVKLADPLDLSVKDFITAFKKKSEPLIGHKHILNNMSLLEKIHKSYEKIKK